MTEEPNPIPLAPKPVEIKEEEEDTDEVTKEWKFSEITVGDLIALKIPPKEFIPSASISINLSWTHMIALINRKSANEKRVNSKALAMDLMKLYGKLMGTSFF